MNVHGSIPVFKPSLKRKDFDAVLTCLVSENIDAGHMTERFVREVCEYIGAAGGVALREYVRTIEMVFDCLQLSAGDKIVLSPLVPSVYLDVIRRRGLVPLFADVEKESGCISASEVEKLLGEGPSLVLVHYPLGFIPDLELLKDSGVPIVEDISTALGGNTGTSKCGRYGRFVILSLEPDGIITTGGGALILAIGRNDKAILDEHAERIGKTAIMPDMNGALGLTQLKSLESFIQVRKEIAGHFERSLMKTRHKSLVQLRESENVYYTFPVLLSGGMKEVRQYAKKQNIVTRPAFEDTNVSVDGIGDRCPVAKSLYLRCLLFPLYPTLGKSNAALIAKVLSSLP